MSLVINGEPWVNGKSNSLWIIIIECVYKMYTVYNIKTKRQLCTKCTQCGVKNLICSVLNVHSTLCTKCT